MSHLNEADQKGLENLHVFGTEHERLALLMESIRDYAIFTTDTEGHVLDWSKGAELILGYTETEAVGQTCDVIFTPEDRAAHAPEQEKETARREGRAEDERWHVRKDGSRFWASGIMTALRRDGELQGYAKILRDLTARKKEEEHQELLARAGATLMSSLESTRILASLAELIVPEYADWCSIHIANPDGTVSPVTVAHADPEMTRYAKELQVKYPVEPGVDNGINRILRTGEPQLEAVVTDEMLRAVAKDEEHYRDLQRVQVRSVLIVPLRARSGNIGTITLISGQPGRYMESDRSFMMELGHRAGLAYENAKLHHEVRSELEQRRRLKADRDRAEREARRQAELLQLAHEAVFAWQMEGGITFWNRGAHDLYGYTSAEVLGKSPHELLATKSAIPIEEVDRLLRSQARWEGVLEHRTKSGETILVESRQQVLPEIDGSLLVLESNRDITARLRDEQELERLNRELDQRVRDRTQELEEAVREMEGFTYSVSHDLRTPMRAIMSTSKILLEDYGGALPPDAAEQLERQARAAKKMGDLIDDLLRLSRIGRQEMQKQEVDLSALAQELADELCASERCGVTFDIQPGLYAQGDPRLLRILLSNLFENSNKFSPTGGVVRFFAEEQRGERVFVVRDQGIGFDPKYTHKLFLLFERLHHDDEYPGTGIGLANVRRIVERHGGRIWAESKLGEGAAFFFTLGG